MNQLPFVSILVVTYLESNQKYLDLCLDSIENLNYPKDRMEVILLSSGEYELMFKESLITVHSHMKTQQHYPESINRGASLADEKTDHYFILNDDVILTKDSLKELVETIGPMECVAQPISNCDNHMRYELQFYAGANSLSVPASALLKRFYRYEEDTKDFWQALKYSRSVYPRGILLQEWVAFYATLIPKKVWDKVGPLDPKYKTGQDDIDYCRRAKALKIPAVVCLSSFVFHFGGVTADQVLDWDTRSYNINYYKEKWGEMPT